MSHKSYQNNDPSSTTKAKKPSNKPANIERFDGAMFSKEELGFTPLSNKVIQNIKCSDSFHVWAYLQSKPITWKPNRVELMNHFGYGKDKIADLLKFLSDSHLLLMHQPTLANGRKGAYEIRILNGSEFIVIETKTRRTRIKPELRLVPASNVTEAENAEPVKNEPVNELSTVTGTVKPEPAKPDYRKERVLQKKEYSNNRTSNYSEVEEAVHKTVVEKIGDKTFTLKQARWLIKNHHQHKGMSLFDSIEFSIKCLLVFLSTDSGKIGKPLAYFIKTIKEDGFFPDTKVYTQDKKPDEARRRDEPLDASHQVYNLRAKKDYTETLESTNTNTRVDLKSLLEKLRMRN